jgi:hypothetical protein
MPSSKLLLAAGLYLAFAAAAPISKVTKLTEQVRTAFLRIRTV